MAEIERHGEYLVDTETGEIVGLSHAAPEFRADTESSVKWVLQQMRKAECQLLALKAEKQQIMADLAVMEKAEQRRLDFLTWRFGADLEQYARHQLGDGKTKSLTTPFGRYGFRQSPGSVAVLPERIDEALDWCRHNCIRAIKTTQSVLVSEIKKSGQLPPPAIFDVVAPHEKFYIDAGVKEAS